MSRQVEYIVLSCIIKERVLNKTLQNHLQAFAPGCRSAAFAEPGRWLWKRNTMDCQYAITWKDVYVPSNWEHHSHMLVVQDILRTINITKIYPLFLKKLVQTCTNQTHTTTSLSSKLQPNHMTLGLSQPAEADTSSSVCRASGHPSSFGLCS